MKIVDLIKADEGKVVNWIQSNEPKFVNSIKEAYALTESILAWRNSAKGVADISLVEALIPQSVKAIPVAVEIIASFSADLAAASNPSAWEGIALRLGAEVLALLDGNKHPGGIDWYIQEFQTIFVG